MFSYVDLECRVRRDQSLRTIRTIVNEALSGLSADFEAIYVAARRSGFFELCCWRPSRAFVRSVRSWSGWSTTALSRLGQGGSWQSTSFLIDV